MTLSRFIKGWILSFVLFSLLDGVWHAGVMAAFYNERLALMNPGLSGPPAFGPLLLALEALNAAAITVFVLKTASAKNALGDGAWIGAFLGLTVSGTLNGLNHILVPAWDATLAMVDTAWGTVVGLIVGIAVAALCCETRHGWFKWLRK